MRKLLIAILFVVCAANLSAQKNPFEQFTEMDGVTSVYISKNMLSLFPKNAKNMNYGGIDVGNFLHKLSSILILTTEDKILENAWSLWQTTKSREIIMSC